MVFRGGEFKVVLLRSWTARQRARRRADICSEECYRKRRARHRGLTLGVNPVSSPAASACFKDSYATQNGFAHHRVLVRKERHAVEIFGRSRREREREETGAVPPPRESSTMKLNPQQAPLYGECLLTVQLDDDDVRRAEGEEEEEEEVEFYLLFSGSTQRHMSSTLRVSHVTLQAVCPAHNACEQVLVTLCCARRGGPVDAHSQETFCFVQDLALDMAGFLLDNTAPQEALLLDDEQIPLRECERLDESLALALKHLSLPHHRTAHTYAQPDVDRQMDQQTQALAATDRRNSETHKETWMDASTLLDSCGAVPQCQQLSRLLHLAASHGLRRVASFLLQRPGGREALRRTDAQGQTAARVAESRGHQRLVELFAQYEASSDTQVEPKEQLHFYPDGRVFQHHANLGTYSLTFPGRRQREGGAETDRWGGCCLQEEVKELRRLTEFHGDTKRESDFVGTITGTPVLPACGLQFCSNGQQESREDAGQALVTRETCRAATEGQGSPASLEEGTQGEDPAVVTHTSCTSGRLCQSQDSGGRQRGTPAANSPAGRNRKNKKRTTKTTRRATESAGNRIIPEACRGAAREPAKTTGSGPETEGTLSPRDPAVPSVIGDGEATKTQNIPGAEETPLPIKPVSTPGGDQTCAGRKAVALPTTATVQKQEGEEWEVDVLICERAAETETVTVSPPARPDQFTSALESAAHRTVTMGQEQSQDPQESQSDPEEPGQLDFINKSPQSGSRTVPRSPDAEPKPWRPLRRDGGWIGSRRGSPPHGPERLAKTVWYQDGHLDQGASEDPTRKETHSQSVWYDSDKMDERKREQLEQAQYDLSSPQASGLSPPLLLGQGLSSHQQCAALSQPHAAGAQPALSHGPAAQRREVHGSQREEEVGLDWKEGGLEGVREEFSNTETTYSRQSSETADIEERGEEKSGSEGAKGRKKRRKKRGRRGGSEAKLSSSSSIESQSQSETQPPREQATSLSPHTETESEAKDQTGRAHVQSATASEPAWREGANEDVMHLPSQTESQTREAHGPDCDVTASESSYTSPADHERPDLTEATASPALETKESSEDESINIHGPDDFNPNFDVTASDLSELDTRKAEGEEITTVQPVRKEVLDPTELESKGAASLVRKTVENMEYKALSENEDLTAAVASVDRTGLVESKCPKELPARHSGPTEVTEDSFLVAFPEQNTQHLESVDSNKPVQASLESVHSTQARGLPREGTALQFSPLQRREGSTETTAREYLEHCLASEMLRDQQDKEEERHELWVGEEEEGKETSRERRSEEEDSGPVHGEESSSIARGKNVEDEDFPSLDSEKERNHAEELVATAVAVVTVAIASAMASVELNQRPAGSQSESRQSAGKEAANDPPLAQDGNALTDSVGQLAEHLLSHVESTQLTNKETRRLSASTPAESEKLPLQHPHTEPTDLFTSERTATVNMSEESPSVTSESETSAEKLPAAQLGHRDQDTLHLSALADTPSLPPLHREEIHTATTQNKVCVKPAPEASDTIAAEVDSQGRMQTGSQLSCPVMDTGQDPEAPDTLGPDCESGDNPQDQSVLQKETAGQLLGTQSQNKETQVRDGSLRVESPTAEGEGGGRTHERDSSENSECKTEDSESCHKGVADMSDSDRQAEERESLPQLLKTPCEGESPPLTLPAGPCDLAAVADPDPDKPAAPVNVETGEFQSSQSLVDTDEEEGASAKDPNSMDTLDGWRQRERDKRDREEEAQKEVVPVEDTSHTEAEPFPAAQEESDQTRRDSDGAHTLQIQRERDVFYPVQPCPQPSTVTPCGDIHPDREECLSVCVLHRDSDSLKVNPELDDIVFKKPDPPPCVRHRDRGDRASLSSTDDASMQGALSPSEGTWSAGTPDALATRSSRLSWKSETEDRGGGGGEEEEKKDQLPENPLSSAILRASIRSLSPFRRHSWEPGRNNAAADIDITQRSSPKSLSGEVKRAKPPLHRRSMSWCPSNLHRPNQEQIDNRSYSLEGLEVQRGGVQTQCPRLSDQEERTAGRSLRLDSQERGSLVSLTEEEQEGDGSSIDSQTSHQLLSMTTSYPAMFHHQNLTKSISMVTISHRDIDVRGFPPSKRRINFSLSISPLLPKTRRFFSIGSSSSDEEEEEGERVSPFTSNCGSLEYSISEEEPGPLRSDTEAKGGPKISRTFSYLRSKMSKKGKEKEKERRGEKERESKEREKKSANGHLFIPVSPSSSAACQHCSKALHNKDTFLCNNCGVHVHKSCRESASVCPKSKAKQLLVPEAAPGSAVNMRSKSTSSASSVSSTSSSSSRERWSTVTTPDDQIPVMFPRRHPSIFNPHSNLAKSISTSNIAGIEDVPLKGLKFLSQSTDSLHQGSKVNASTESLTDEGTEMMDSQLMGEFECDIKDLEADSWSSTVDKKFLKQVKKDEIKRQDVIYELYQTEFHHVRTLKIMSEVYYKGLQREVQLETDTLDKIFPVLDDLLHMHTEFFSRLLETRRASSAQGQNNNSFLICRIGDVLVHQFSDCGADRMKKVYGKFCSRHNEAVNLYKDLHAKDKRFQAFIKRTMTSSIVRRLSIPECILLVTQRITKYPVLIQRILQHTKDSDGDHSGVCESLRCVKELIAAVDSKVNEQEKKRRLREVHSRTDSKSIMRMKSGQMFAKEDLIRGRKLLHDGALQLKNSAGRLKDVHAMLLSDVLVFLQEKDQKYVFASLDQRSTVISLQNLIVREVANEERGLFLITAGTERPEMVEVLASSKEERNTWRTIIQDAMHCMEKDEDEGVPSETEEDRRQQESRVKEIRELLRRKDEQIISLLEEKVHVFRELGDCSPATEDTNPPVRERMLFRATPDDVTKGEPIIKDALREVESLRALVSAGVGGAGCGVPAGLTGGSVGPVCLPRRAETFGGFDSHQMNSSKNGEKEEGDESLDLRRTESDSVLKKGASASLQMMLKRNNEQVQHSVTHLHDLLISLQAVVIQQDSFVEDQRQALNDRLAANSSRHSSSSSLSSSSSSRPSSLIEQEKHRSLERQRQEAASLQKQQAAHQEEKRRREKEWELKEKGLAEWEQRLRGEEEETRRRHQELLEERETLRRKKEEYQRELERLREAQRRLERDKETLRRDTDRLEAMRRDEVEQLQRYQRTPSTTSEDSIRFHSSGSLDLDSKEAAEEPKEVELSSSAPTKEPFLRIGSKRMGKNFNPFFSSSSSKPQGAEKSQESQLPNRLLQLAKPKEKKDKKKKKGKGGEQTQTENKVTVMSDPQNDGDIFFC
ncbi:A-kinase anchor protein 13-like isoform X2 [Xiphias gladius]|uniref:A-kinase anchor protein 13-like isoform X2 n=1 Tax=Xiphias gladius TaxID=8245 RepID=UPI001A9A2150|nr:A-kinase anchor protein 13-like isoform X2 [Xiphias gladius]